MNKETESRKPMQLFEVTATPMSGGRAHILFIMARNLEHAHRRARALLSEVSTDPMMIMRSAALDRRSLFALRIASGLPPLSVRRINQSA